MFRKNNIAYLLLIFAYINFINILFIVIRLSGFVIVRPLILYDYFLIAILIVFRVHSIIVWICFAVILLLEMVQQASALFLFSVPEMIRSLEFSSLYEISPSYYFLLVLFLLFLYLNYLLIKKISSLNSNLWIAMLFFLGSFVIIYSVDYFNGSTGLTSRKALSITKLNIAGSSVKDLGRIIINLTHTSPKPIPISHSVTYDAFAKDSTGNQLLIILESWGLPNNPNDWEMLKESIVNTAKEEEWNILISSTSFKGGTTHAELRELLKVEGEYHYFLKQDSAKQIESIFNLKKKQGYSIAAAHSFSGKMFERKLWWKNIGIDSAYFLEDGLSQKTMNNKQLNYATPFTSLNDEDAFSFLNTIDPLSQKRFAYLLTENTHLSFYQKNFKDNPRTITFGGKLSLEANNQLRRIQELLFFFIKSTYKGQWSKVVIVGDHMPPFSNESDRNFYAPGKVPYVVLSK